MVLVVPDILAGADAITHKSNFSHLQVMEVVCLLLHLHVTSDRFYRNNEVPNQHPALSQSYALLLLMKDLGLLGCSFY